MQPRWEHKTRDATEEIEHANHLAFFASISVFHSVSEKIEHANHLGFFASISVSMFSLNIAAPYYLDKRNVFALRSSPHFLCL